ncbi:MAG: hypothetical protein J6J38_00650 [Lachnospiraceae bacterium]|nr:hypothetical protein [Lachnospiraceae bacterium]
MKKKLTHNLWLKLLSLGIAIVFWFVIINSEDPIGSREFKNIPVKVLNKDQVLEREKVLEILDGDTVDVVVEGRRSQLDLLTESDIEATADLLEVSFMDTVLVKATVPNYPDITVMNNGENVMKLLFDDYVTERFSFRVDTTGEPMAGYYVGDALPSPNIIQISGAKTVLDKIKEVVLEVDVSGRSIDFTTITIPVVYDMNGDKISSSKLNLQVDSDAVTVNVPILASKEMKVRVTTTGEVPDGYELLPENIAFQPETIRVAGSKEDLEKLGYYLTLEVDVTGQTGTIEKNIPISTMLDDALTSLRVVDTQIAAVKVTVTPYEEQTLDIPVGKIEVQNLENGLKADFGQDVTIPVTLRYKKARAPLITVEHLNPYVDLDGYTEGTYKIPLRLELPSKVLWDEEKELDVVISGDVQ